jgi:hypothetical protein
MHCLLLRMINIYNNIVLSCRKLIFSSQTTKLAKWNYRSQSYPFFPHVSHTWEIISSFRRRQILLFCPRKVKLQNCSQDCKIALSRWGQDCKCRVLGFLKKCEANKFTYMVSINGSNEWGYSSFPVQLERLSGMYWWLKRPNEFEQYYVQARLVSVWTTLSWKPKVFILP